MIKQTFPGGDGAETENEKTMMAQPVRVKLVGNNVLIAQGDDDNPEWSEDSFIILPLSAVPQLIHDLATIQENQ